MYLIVVYNLKLKTSNLILTMLGLWLRIQTLNTYIYNIYNIQDHEGINPPSVPLCPGTDNKTYDSSCHFFATKCALEGTKKGHKLHLDYLGACKCEWGAKKRHCFRKS